MEEQRRGGRSSGGGASGESSFNSAPAQFQNFVSAEQSQCSLCDLSQVVELVDEGEHDVDKDHHQDHHHNDDDDEDCNDDDDDDDDDNDDNCSKRMQNRMTKLGLKRTDKTKTKCKPKARMEHMKKEEAKMLPNKC